MTWYGTVLLVLAALCFLLCIVIASIISRRMCRPLEEIIGNMKSLEGEQFSTRAEVRGNDEISLLARQFNRMAQKIQSLIEEVYLVNIRKKELELRALQAQVNPHFLYNTLDSVVWMTENGRTQEATVMLTALARLFRISLSRGSNIIPIADELEHARHYLTIQKMRYKNKFSAVIAAEDGVEGLYTIKLIVQPILENAIYHGMAYADGDGEITVRARRDGGDVVIEVADNGPGMPEEMVERLLDQSYAAAPGTKGSGIGLRNVHQRIRLTFGEEYGLAIHSEPDAGTTVCIRLPVLEGPEAAAVRREGEA